MKKFFLLGMAIIACCIESSAQTGSNGCVKEINAQQFYASVGKIDNAGDFKIIGNKPVVIHFDAAYARPSRELKPILEDYANRYKGKVDFYRMNISINNADDTEELKVCNDMISWMRKNNIPIKTPGIPLLIFIRSDGRCSGFKVGYNYIKDKQGHDAEILDKIKKIAYMDGNRATTNASPESKTENSQYETKEIPWQQQIPLW